MSAQLQKKIRQWRKDQASKMSSSTADIRMQPGDSAVSFGKLSARAIGICQRNGLSGVRTLLDHYYVYATFQMFLGCGANTDQELMAFCRDLAAKDYRIRCWDCQYTGIRKRSGI
jgi:hypothetical protein